MRVLCSHWTTWQQFCCSCACTLELISKQAITVSMTRRHSERPLTQTWVQKALSKRASAVTVPLNSRIINRMPHLGTLMSPLWARLSKVDFVLTVCIYWSSTRRSTAPREDCVCSCQMHWGWFSTGAPSAWAIKNRRLRLVVGEGLGDADSEGWTFSPSSGHVPPISDNHIYM